MWVADPGGCDQPPGQFVVWFGGDGRGRALFDHAAGIEDQDLIRDSRDQTEVVTDPDQRRTAALQFGQQVEDERRTAVVEGGRDLVADQYVGAREDGASQGGALELAAGEPARRTGRGDRGNAEAGESGDGFGVGLVRGESAQALRRTGDLLVDGTAFVEGAADFLPDVLDAAGLLAGAVAEDRERFTVEEDPAGVALMQAGETAGQGGLAAAGAPDNAETGAGADVEIDLTQYDVTAAAAARQTGSLPVATAARRRGSRGRQVGRRREGVADDATGVQDHDPGRERAHQLKIVTEQQDRQPARSQLT